MTCIRPPSSTGGLSWSCTLRALILVSLTATLYASTDQDAEIHVLPPWTIEETLDRHQRSASSDYFASSLGPSSVVTAIDWSGRGITTLAEALRKTPGVMLQESFGGFEPPRLSIRGSGLNSAPSSRGVALLIDGLPLARADGSFHSGLFDPLLFPRIEIYRGTLHMALTPAVLGGVLNAVSYAPNPNRTTVLRSEGDDLGAFRSQLTATIPGSTSFQAAASFQQADGWRDHSGQERTAIRLAAHRPLTNSTQLEVSVYAATAEYDVPGPLTLGNAQTQPQSIFAPVKRDQPRRDSTIGYIAVQLKSRVPDGSNAFGLAWLQMNDDFYQLQPNGETDLDARSLSGHATFSRRLNIGQVEHQFLTRFTFSTGQDDVDRYLNVFSQRGARFGTYEARAYTAAVSIEDVVWLKPTLAFGVGFTALHGERKVTGQAPTTNLRSKLTFDDFSPRAALLWAPHGNLSLHAAISRSIEPPTFDDLVAREGAYPNLTLGPRSLTPQSAITYEIGARGTHGSLDWNLTTYHAKWQQEILRLADASGQPRGAVNANETIHEGIETSLRWRVLDDDHKVSISVTSMLSHFHFDQDPVYGNNRLAGAPPHTGNAELLYKHPNGFFAALETTWVAGRVPVDHANRLFYDGSTLGHIRLGWRSASRWLVYATVRNVFDQQHIASTAGVLDLARNPAATTIFLPGVGRGFTLGFELKL